MHLRDQAGSALVSPVASRPSVRTSGAGVFPVASLPGVRWADSVVCEIWVDRHPRGDRMDCFAPGIPSVAALPGHRADAAAQARTQRATGRTSRVEDW